MVMRGGMAAAVLWAALFPADARAAGAGGALPADAPGIAVPLDAAALQQAQAENALRFDIPAQPLPEALTAFGRQSGWQLTYPSPLAQGQRSRAVSGRHTPAEALNILLGGTGITWRPAGDRAVTLTRIEDESGAMTLNPITVEGRASTHQAEIGNLPPVLEGTAGQIARGGKLGVLGNKDMMDTPFSQTSFTAKFIEDRQATYIDDVLRADPSVVIGQPASTGFYNVSIRGFDSNPSSYLYDGLPGLSLFQLESTGSLEATERVELLRGPSGLLNGAASPTSGTSIGGVVNLVPKRAEDEPLTSLTGSYVSDSQVGAHGDVGRRFGKNKEFGVRVNGALLAGDLPIDHASRDSRLAVLAADYRGDRFRLAADLGYQEMHTQGGRFQLGVANGLAFVPSPPDTRTNWNAPTEFNDVTGYYGALHGEFDITGGVTAFIKAGGAQTERQSAFSSRQINNVDGTLSAGNMIGFTREMHNWTSTAGARAALQTGPVQHQAVAAFAWQQEYQARALTTSAIPASSIYNPNLATVPATLAPDLDDTRKGFDAELTSFVLGDTMSILEERVQLTVGVRHQRIDLTNYNTTTGDATSIYDEDTVTPMVGLVVKPWQNVSLYASYIEGLERGQTAPTGTANAGDVFAPFTTESYEAGVKVDFGRFAATLAVFQTTLPSAITDPATNIFSVDGEQRHRGVEVGLFGEIAKGIRLLGGVSFLNAVLTETAGGVNEGNKALVPEWQARLGAEWDTPFVEGMTLTGFLSYASEQYVDQANTQEIPDWAQLDLGARYAVTAYGTPVTVRFNVTNVFDSNEWAGPRFGGVVARDPRTFKLSVKSDF
ncbi:MAG: TonB-dependent siderophore receptor [Alphaproteobacteria bacterium]|nr:TonB-dependent siderophore receptor [Alphaproteobacteria bacterium]